MIQHHYSTKLKRCFAKLHSNIPGTDELAEIWDVCEKGEIQTPHILYLEIISRVPKWLALIKLYMEE